MEEKLVTLSALLALGLAAVHFTAGKLRFLKGLPRNRWLSIAGGASVAYVFLHLLPELSRREAVIQKHLLPSSFIEHRIYLVALVGLVTFYGLERLAKTSRQRQQQLQNKDATHPLVFWIHIGSFTLYNMLIGYLLLHLEQRTTFSLMMFGMAMGLHFVVTDFGLENDHKQAYERLGRWILVGAILAGWTVGYVTEVSELTVATLIAFLAGGVILNVLKEELPAERESRFGAFLLGAAGYGALLLFL